MKKPEKHCLLVVDDEEDLVDSVKDLLRFEYKVLGATRAMEALKLMDQHQVHIVMSDQCMPEMTGVEFLSRLREKYPDTVRLLFTAYADIKAVINAINQGNVYRYITKPWEQDDLLTVLRQATEYYDLQAERKRLMTELKDKNEQLVNANQELKQANELKKAFIKVASHELRTPLTIVMGMADLAHKTPGVKPPVNDWIERMFVGSRRLNEKVNQMEKLLLADRYDRQLVRSKVDVKELLVSAAEEVKTFANIRKQQLELDIAEDVGTMELDRDKIKDCILQLLINAVKFTPDGGKVSVSCKRTANGVEIQVSDTGVGIAPESMKKIFDPFFTRFDVSKHSSGVFEFDRRGLGLGLSVVKAFTEMHGGEVRVVSQPNQGSTFTVMLPDNQLQLNGN